MDVRDNAGNPSHLCQKGGPFEIILWVVIIGAILMAIGGLLLGFFLIAIPFMAALIIIGIVSAVVRGYFHRQ